MTDDKTEFNLKGTVNELITDNGPSFRFLRAEYKNKDDGEAIQKQQLERATDLSYIGLNKK